mmetsp:Transcript_23296/g.66776  ORF Transcript_23296/g.66776 Transcript_23296/m.66776 type:complete len:122 (-) Transcript_23296:775-1140(-)
MPTRARQTDGKPSWGNNTDEVPDKTAKHGSMHIALHPRPPVCLSACLSVYGMWVCGGPVLPSMRMSRYVTAARLQRIDEPTKQQIGKSSRHLNVLPPSLLCLPVCLPGCLADDCFTALGVT